MRAIVQSKDGFITRLILESPVLSKVRGPKYHKCLARNLALIRDFGIIISTARAAGITVDTSKLNQFVDREVQK